MSSEPPRDFGRYRILGELGRGAMGAVFRARDAVLRRDVALKLLRAPGTGEGSPPPQGPSRLLSEARAAAAINHPNAVSIYDLGEVDGTPYIAMELVEGRTLRTYIGDPSIPTAVRVGWLVDIARALAAAHARGVVHRDVKPENIIVRHDGVLKVLDFGIAKQLSADTINTLDTFDTLLETKPGTLVGTPAYMAPEQVRGEPADAATDQFAWGVVAYELLAGERPWGADLQGLRAIAEMVSREPAHLGRRNRVIPASLADVVMRALERERSRRFASMNEVLARFDAGAVGPAPPLNRDASTLIQEPALAVGAGRNVAPGTAAGAPPLALAPTLRAAATGKPRRRPALAIAALVLGGAAALAAALVRGSGSPSPEIVARTARMPEEATMAPLPPTTAPIAKEAAVAAKIPAASAAAPGSQPPPAASGGGPGSSLKPELETAVPSTSVAPHAGKHHPRLAGAVANSKHALSRPAPSPAPESPAMMVPTPAERTPAPSPAPSPYEDPN